MSIPPEQQETVAFLRTLSGAEPIETHISLVFRAADEVLKLKKAVRLSFLDFTEADARRRFIEREFLLNSPFAPGLYRGVASVLRAPDGKLRLDGDGEAIDWVLRMARVPEADFLDRIAEAHDLSPDLLDALADSVVAFHAALPPAKVTGNSERMRAVALGNARSALEAGLPAAAVANWRTSVQARIGELSDWLDRRGEDGFVRRAHGDLHLGNICVWQGRPVPFDALEFDEEMATVDLGYDLAFLLMDLDRRAGRPAANRVLNRAVALNGDPAVTRGLPLFLSLRSLVRAHVQARRNGGDADDYLQAALGYLRPGPAIVVAVGGLPGTGKTTLARALAPALGNAPGALVLRSDETRKRLHGVAPEQALPPPAYAEAVSARVFRALAADAGEVARGGHAVIADATFLDPSHREQVASAAAAAGAPFVGLWLEAPLPELERRIAARGKDASDATIAVLREASRRDPGVRDWQPIDASDAAAALAAAQECLRKRMAPC